MSAYYIIEAADWDRLKKKILDGYEEDISEYDHKDYPEIFDIVHSDDPGAEEMACFWLEHGYQHFAIGGRSRLTIAHTAAQAGKPGVIRKLIELGADVNREDNDSHTPLWSAACYGHAECVRVLLEAGADPDGFEDRSDGHTETPLSVADTPEIAAMLLQAGADMDICMYNDSLIGGRAGRMISDELVTPLAHTCYDGRADVAHFLLKKVADPNERDGQAMRLLAVSRKPSLRLLSALLKAGAMADAKALQLAAFRGNAKLCQALMDAGAKAPPDSLELAVQSGNLPCVQVMLETDDPPDTIRVAARENLLEILAWLLGQYPESLGSALHGAIEGCQFELARELAVKADPNSRDYRGLTPIARLFSLDRRIETWRRIINARKKYKLEMGPGRFANVPEPWELTELDRLSLNMRHPNNWNDLVALFEDEVLELVRLMLNRGADLRAVDNMGRSVLWHACAGSWLESIPWLLDMGLSLSQRDRDGVSCFKAGCLSHESYTIEPMLSRGYNVNARDENGDTPLLKAARDPKERKGWSSVIFWLLKSGADPDMSGSDGSSFRNMARGNKGLGRTLEWAEKERKKFESI